MCEKCEPFGGLWRETPTGLKRCDCGTGKRLVEIQRQRENPTPRPPVISEGDVTVFVQMLGVMRYFPSESGARLLIGEEIRSMCASSADALGLVQRIARTYDGWPGMKEMRRVYCETRVPLDGLIDNSPSEVYPGGIPSERPQVVAAPMKALPVGKVTADRELESAVRQLASKKVM